MLESPPLSVYVHLPWCVRKCPYCDFNSHVAPAQIPEERYVDALLQDFQLDLDWLAGRPIHSVFFGGGTPSLFSARAIGAVLDGLAQHAPFESDAEVTLEANPGTIEHDAFSAYRTAGVNRVSLGAQSFSNAQLQRLGRVHDADHIHRAVGELHAAGLSNFNLDLMYGLPQQTLHDAQADVRTAIALGPTHLSHYQLALEPGTVFYHRPPSLPEPDEIWQMQLSCQEILAEHGFEQYEVSAYAQPGRPSRHNLNYWRFGDYLGLGAGAHGKLTQVTDQRVVRTTRQRQPREYLARRAEARVEVRAVDHQDLGFEFMLNALRLREGFRVALLQARTGLPLSALELQLAEASRRGMLERSGEDWQPTDLGRRFLNDLQELFLPSPVTNEPRGRSPSHPT